MSAIYFQMVEQENIYEYFEAEKNANMLTVTAH